MLGVASKSSVSLPFWIHQGAACGSEELAGALLDYPDTALASKGSTAQKSDAPTRHATTETEQLIDRLQAEVELTPVIQCFSTVH